MIGRWFKPLLSTGNKQKKEHESNAPISSYHSQNKYQKLCFCIEFLLNKCLDLEHSPDWGKQCRLCWGLRHEDWFWFHWWDSLNLDSVIPREMGISEEDKPLQVTPRWTMCLILLSTSSAPNQYIIHSINPKDSEQQDEIKCWFYSYLVEEESVALKCWRRKIRSQRESLSHDRDGIRESLSRIDMAMTRSFSHSF